MPLTISFCIAMQKHPQNENILVARCAYFCTQNESEK